MVPSAPAIEPGRLRQLLARRLGGREALQEALLQALFGHDDFAALGPRERQRLAALLERHADEALAALAWQGHAGRGTLCLQVDVLFDGQPDAAAVRASLAQLAQLLRTQQWPDATLAVRSVLVTESPQD